MTTTITGEIQEPNIELDILLTTAEGDDYDDNAGDDDGDNDDDDDDDDESNTCRPKPEEKLNEKPAKDENLEVVERKYHLSIVMIISFVMIRIIMMMIIMTTFSNQVYLYFKRENQLIGE